MDYFDQSNQLITDILQEAASLVTENWDSIGLTVNFTYEDKVATTADIQFIYMIGEEAKTANITPVMTDNLLKLANLNTSEKGMAKKAIFTLSSAGKFDVNYEY